MPSATQLLRRDHKKVEGLFTKFEQAKTPSAKARICEQVIQELEIHAKLEEEIFYPAVRKHVGEEEMLEEAKQEHQQAKEIMRELKKIGPEDEQLEDKFSELVEGVKHHVEEEEGEMLPKAEESEMDLSDIGEQMTERREELLQQAEKTQSGKGKSTRKAKSTSRRRKSGRAA
jgi:signal recognition particle subunit SEC65